MSESDTTPPAADGLGDAPDGRRRRSEREPASGAPKRRGKGKKKHTVGKILLACVLVLALATGLGVVFLYRHLNGNLEVIDPFPDSSNRPQKVEFSGPQEPINVLVMGSDDRDAPGNRIDNEDIGGADRSDTTILMHLSADRKHAYGISIPRDSLVTRPECKNADGDTIPGGTEVMWNDAFALGGPACTVRQVEKLTGVYVDHVVVVDFNGFEGMVDAIGGVPVCIPEPIVDPAHGINIPAGTREIEGRQALNYVRARYTLGDGSDISRIKRQQAFIASMAHKVLSADVFSRPDHLIRFLNAATKSLQVDEGIDDVVKISKIAWGFKNIGFDNIKFITVPIAYYPTDSEHPGKVYWVQPQANRLWSLIKNDEVLPQKFLSGAITAQGTPGSKGGKGGKGGGHKPNPDAEAEAAANGLCA